MHTQEIDLPFWKQLGRWGLVHVCVNAKFPIVLLATQRQEPTFKLDEHTTFKFVEHWIADKKENNDKNITSIKAWFIYIKKIKKQF